VTEAQVDWWHDTRKEILTQFCSWFEGPLGEVRDQRAIQLVALPDPSDPTSHLELGLAGPTTVTVIVVHSL
jgi:hypothetical protein